MDTNEQNQDKHEQYSQRGMGEGNPGDINPNDLNHVAPSKSIHEAEELKRNESALGHNQSHKASSEMDQQISQIDEGTKEMLISKQDQSMEQTKKKEFDTDDSNRIDERDQHDSTEDWDAEQSSTGRNK